MLWNVFLAVIPVIFAQLIVMLAIRHNKNVLDWALITVLGIVWLAFLPNTCYLITEWRHFLTQLDIENLYVRAHLSSFITVWLMTYTALYFCYSGIGMIAFTLAIRPLARMLKEKGVITWIPGIILFTMLSIGVYLGLVHRYNSWDLLNRPSEILSSITTIANRPILTSLVIVFAAFLWLSYFAIDVWIDGFLGRWNAIFTQARSNKR